MTHIPVIPSGSVSRVSWTYQGKKHSGYRYTLNVVDAEGARQRYRKQFATRVS